MAITRFLGIAVGVLVTASCGLCQAATYDDFITAYLANPPSTFNSSGVTVKLKTDDVSTYTYANGKTYGNHSSLRGGEFRVEITSNGSYGGGDFGTGVVTRPMGTQTWVWETFCVEPTETFDASKSYVVTIDAGIYKGSDPTQASPEPIEAGTKLLYALFFEGRLDDAEFGLGYSYFNNDWANALQIAFWELETSDYYQRPFSTLNTQVNALLAFARNVMNQANIQVHGEVLALNLWNGIPYNDYKAAQTQLIYVPHPPEAPGDVPEPMTLAIWSGLSICGLGMARRHRRKSSA